MKNIVLCSDGTGNSGGKTRGTNVWRLFNAIDRYNPTVRQITFYDDGVGTDDARWMKVLGGAFGWGLSRNICQLYTFLAMNYEAGQTEKDKVFLFGFSRGAFTVRALAGMICKCGLLDRQYFERSDCDKLVKRILNAYRQKEPGDLDRLKKESVKLKEIDIEVIGVWDTVDAVGVPFDELRTWFDGGYKAVTGRRLYGFHDGVLNKKVKHGYQALAIDEERKTFHPNVWDARQNVEQVWFSGAHSNVGGGYAKDAMSLITLDWMMGKAARHNLKFLQQDWEDSRRRADVHAKLYDSRTGSAVYYRYAPRNMGDEPLVHASVYGRIKRGTERYAPGIIPGGAKPAHSDHGPYASNAAVDTPKLDEPTVREVRQLARRRKRLYLFFVSFNVVGAALVIWTMLNPSSEAAGVAAGSSVDPGWLASGLARAQELVKLLVPGMLERLVEIIWKYPIPSAVFIVIFGILRRVSTRTKRKMKEKCFAGWRQACGS